MKRHLPAGRYLAAAALVGATAVLLRPEPAAASVYSWQDDDGALHFTNMARQVPEVYRTVTKSDGGATEPEWQVDVESATAAPEPREPAREARRERGGDAYTDGVRAGLEAATENVRAVGEVLDRLLDRESERQARRETSRDEAPRRVPILDPSPRDDEPRVVVRVVGRDDDRFVRYGALGPYPIGSPYCCSDSLGYGFAYGSFPPHSHFDPTPENLTRAHLFFPDGHYSRGGFLFGHGFLAD